MNLSGRLPGGDANGLDYIANALVPYPKMLHVVIAIVDCRKVTLDSDDGTKTPTVRIRRLEVVPSEDRSPCERLLARAYERRTGQTTLPIDLEDDVRSAFDGLEPEDLMPPKADGDPE